MPKLEQNSNSFSEFNIITETWVELREDLILPLRIDIADISFNDDYFIYNKFEKVNNGICVDITPNPFEQLLLKSKIKSEMCKLLKFVDNHNKLYEEEESKEINGEIKTVTNHITLFEHLQVKNVEEFYDWMIMNEITDEDLSKLKSVIITYINQITDVFKTRAFELLKVNTCPKTSSSMPKINFKNYDTDQTQCFIKLQAVTEYHASMVYFPENVNKSLAEISWRELQLRMLFLHRKNQIDSELKKIENDAMKTPTESPKKVITGR